MMEVHVTILLRGGLMIEEHVASAHGSVERPIFGLIPGRESP
jgi:hypothetical protein